MSPPCLPLHPHPRRSYIIFYPRASIPFLLFRRWFSYKFPRRAQLSHKVLGLMESFCALEVFGFFDNPISDVRWMESKKNVFVLCTRGERTEEPPYIGNSTTHTTICLYTRQPQRCSNFFFSSSPGIFIYLFIYFLSSTIFEKYRRINKSKAVKPSPGIGFTVC